MRSARAHTTSMSCSMISSVTSRGSASSSRDHRAPSRPATCPPWARRAAGARRASRARRRPRAGAARRRRGPARARRRRPASPTRVGDLVGARELRRPARRRAAEQRRSCRAVPRLRREPHVLPHGRRGKRLVRWNVRAMPRRGHAVRRQPVTSAPAEDDAARASGGSSPRDQVEERRLARAVRPDDRAPLARATAEQTPFSAASAPKRRVEPRRRASSAALMTPEPDPAAQQRPRCPPARRARTGRRSAPRISIQRSVYELTRFWSRMSSARPARRRPSVPDAADDHHQQHLARGRPEERVRARRYRSSWRTARRRRPANEPAGREGDELVAATA